MIFPKFIGVVQRHFLEIHGKGYASHETLVVENVFLNPRGKKCPPTFESQKISVRGEIVPAIKRAIDSGKPACVNVLTDPTITSPATFMLGETLKME